MLIARLGDGQHSDLVEKDGDRGVVGKAGA
jgi:hypothetical protein